MNSFMNRFIEKLKDPKDRQLFFAILGGKALGVGALGQTDTSAHDIADQGIGLAEDFRIARRESIGGGVRIRIRDRLARGIGKDAGDRIRKYRAGCA